MDVFLDCMNVFLDCTGTQIGKKWVSVLRPTDALKHPLEFTQGGQKVILVAALVKCQKVLSQNIRAQ